MFDKLIKSYAPLRRRRKISRNRKKSVHFDAQKYSCTHSTFIFIERRIFHVLDAAQCVYPLQCGRVKRKFRKCHNKNTNLIQFEFYYLHRIVTIVRYAAFIFVIRIANDLEPNEE